MASLTINPGTIINTLSQHSCGWGHDQVNYFDLDNAAMRQLAVDAAPEVERFVGLNFPMNNLGYVKFREYAKYLQTQIGSAYSVLLFTGAMPTPGPSAEASSVTAAVSTSAGVSPADHAVYFGDLINYGINIIGWEWQNEAANMIYGLGGGAPWYSIPTYGQLTAQFMAEDWCNIHHRNVMATYSAKVTAMGRTGLTKLIGCETAAVTNNNGYNYTKAFIKGEPDASQTWSGVSNPNHASPSNIPYLDIVAIHSYGEGQFLNIQGYLNSYFWDSGGTEAQYLAEMGDPNNQSGGKGKGRFRAAFRLLRAYLDANGGSSVKFVICEGGGLIAFNQPSSGVYDVVQAISFCQIAHLYGLEYLLVWAFARSSDAETNMLGVYDDGIWNRTDPATYLPTQRYYAFRDMWGHYMKTFKRQVQITITAPAANTPPSVSNNPVPRIQACAGLNSDGSKMGIMVANIDTTSTPAEQVTISWGSAAQGTITGRRLPQNHPQLSTPMPTIAPFGNGATSLTTGVAGAPTMVAGDSFLFEIPLAPGQPPPPPTGDPHIGNWTTAVQINAGGIAPPPSLDQHLGNWSTAAQVTIRTSSRTVGTGHNTGIARTVGGTRNPGVGGGGG